MPLSCIRRRPADPPASKHRQSALRCVPDPVFRKTGGRGQHHRPIVVAELLEQPAGETFAVIDRQSDDRVERSAGVGNRTPSISFRAFTIQSRRPYTHRAPPRNSFSGYRERPAQPPGPDKAGKGAPVPFGARHRAPLRSARPACRARTPHML